MESIYEVSYFGNKNLHSLVDNYSDEDRAECCDPFDLVAAKEEEEDCPLVFSY